MFDKFKQIQQLRELQKQMKDKRVEVESGGVEVVVNGNMEIEEVVIGEGADQTNLGESVKDAVNKAIKKIQTEIAGVMQSGGLGL